MAKRVTILLEEDVYKKLRTLQAKEIVQNEGSFSFSKAINETLRKNLK